jgi:hypothetical protein
VREAAKKFSRRYGTDDDHDGAGELTMTKLPAASFLLPALFLTLVGVADNNTIALPEPNSPFVAFNIWVKSGSAADPRARKGWPRSRPP